MELKHYFAVLAKWAWLLLLAPIVVASISFAVSKRMEPVYQASTTLLISQTGDASRADYNALLTSERIAKTYAELITKRPVLEKVITDLQLEMTPRQLAGDIDVSLPSSTQLLIVRVRSNDAIQAVAIANSVAATFLERNGRSGHTTYSAYEQVISGQLQKVQGEIQTVQQDLNAALERKKTLPDDAEEGVALLLDREIRQLQQSLDDARRTYATLLSSYLQISDQDNSAIQMEIVEPAALPARKIRPRIAFNTGIAAFAGLMLALGLVFLLDYLDESLESLESVEQALGIPALTIVPSITDREASSDQPMALLRPTSTYAEALRGLRTSIQFNMLREKQRTLLVTSSFPQEGKSTTLANLGLVMAQAGKRVLLVDADLRQGNLHTVFGVSNRVGLTDLLVHRLLPDESTLADTGIPNLFLLPHGARPTASSELLGSDHMAALLEHLNRFVDVILVDSPPVLALTDALVLAPQVDGVLMVVQVGRVSRPDAQKAIRHLQSVGANLMGAILTQGKVSSSEYYGYYLPQTGRFRRLLNFLVPTALQRL